MSADDDAVYRAWRAPFGKQEHASAGVVIVDDGRRQARILLPRSGTARRLRDGVCAGSRVTSRRRAPSRALALATDASRHEWAAARREHYAW